MPRRHGQRKQGSTMNKERSDLRGTYNRLYVYKWLLNWLHILLATAAGLSYVYRGIESNFPYWLIGASVNTLFHASFAMWPYLISWFVLYRNPVNLRALALWPYITLLIGSTIAVIHIYVAPAIPDTLNVGLVTVLQAFLYLICSSWVITRST